MLWVTVWTSWWSWAIWGRRVCRVGTKEHLPSRLWSYNKWQHPGQALRCSYWPGPWRNGCRLCFCSLGSLATQRIKRGKWHVRKLASKKTKRLVDSCPRPTCRVALSTESASSHGCRLPQRAHCRPAGVVSQDGIPSLNEHNRGQAQPQ